MVRSLGAFAAILIHSRLCKMVTWELMVEIWGCIKSFLVACHCPIRFRSSGGHWQPVPSGISWKRYICDPKSRSVLDLVDCWGFGRLLGTWGRVDQQTHVGALDHGKAEDT